MLNSSNPLISICIPVYNGEEFLLECLQSALAQDYNHFEIIAVDDSSTDASWKLLTDLAKNHERLIATRNPRQLGLVENWNECVKQANGDWIKFLFQDDLLEPQCLSKMIAASLDGPTSRAVICNRNYFHANDYSPIEFAEKYQRGGEFWDCFPKLKTLESMDLMRLVSRWNGSNCLGEPPSFLLQKSLFSELGLFDGQFIHYCDFEYWLRVLANTPIAMVNSTLVHFRVHTASASSDNWKNNYIRTRHIDRILLFKKLIEDEQLRIRGSSLLRSQWKNYLYSHASLFHISMRREAKRQGSPLWDRHIETFTNENLDFLNKLNRNLVVAGAKYYAWKFTIYLRWQIWNIGRSYWRQT